MIKCEFESGKTTYNLRHVTMDALVEKDDKILLMKRSSKLSLEPGKWALPGGYLDKDETTQQGVLRELQEETGLSGKVMDLFKIIDTPKRKGDKGRQNFTLVYLIKPFKKDGNFQKETQAIGWFGFGEIQKMKQKIAFDHYPLIIKPFMNFKKTRVKRIFKINQG
ncbi:MAG: NUDIX domain-containing protein [Candidatus Moranbacteria bacterium]|nr:NUDIX domain-containing protein [Candidatus Moranbacteria bacterium]